MHGVEIALFNVYELDERVRSAALRDSATILSEPSFRHRVAATYPLDDVAAAHEAVESGGMIGNVLLAIDD